MTINEAIQKFRLTAAERDGQRGLSVGSLSKPTVKEVNWIRENKIAILAELDAREATKKAAEQAEIDNILNGKTIISVSYCDGEYLSGWEVYGKQAKLLEKIGFVKYVSGWGYHISDDAIKTLGQEFNYPAAVEYMRPATEAAEAKKAKEQAELQVKFGEAKAIGKPVLIKSYMAECNDPREECSTDVVSIYAMPDGSRSTERQHTW